MYDIANSEKNHTL